MAALDSPEARRALELKDHDVPEDVTREAAFFTNSRGMKLRYLRVSPKEQEPKAVLFFCIGYVLRFYS
jgi:hypothetical protein